MPDPFLGEIRMVGFNFAPAGWALCNGQRLPISGNEALYSLLGTMYGGNGHTDFALPNLQGRAPVHMGQSPGTSHYVPGQMGGSETVALTQSQLPTHSHAAVVTGSVNSATGTMQVASAGSNESPTPSATNNVLGASGPNGPASAAIWSDDLGSDPVTLANPVNVNVNTGDIHVQVGQAGASLPFGVLGPYTCVNFIICTESGVYPPRG